MKLLSLIVKLMEIHFECLLQELFCHLKVDNTVLIPQFEEKIQKKKMNRILENRL